MQKTFRVVQTIGGAILALLTGYNLYREEFNPDAPAFVKIFNNTPWWVWLILLILIFTIPYIVRLANGKSNQENGSQEIEQEGKGHTAYQAGGDISITYPKEENHLKEVATELTWEGVEFSEWKPHTLLWVLGGVKIYNDKKETIEKCKVEAVQYFPGLPTGHYLPISEAYENGILPLALCWIANGVQVCEPIDISPETEGYVGLVYQEEIDGVKQFIFQGWGDIQHVGFFTQISYTIIRISGSIKSSPIIPTKKLVVVELQGFGVKRLEVRDIK